MGSLISGLVCNLITMPYPIYASFKAIESSEKDDDTQWLTYWIVYSTFTVIESFTDFFIFWVPFYYTIKLIFLIALQLPQLNLAATLYNSYLRPFLKQNEQKIDKALKEGKESLDKISHEAQDEMKKRAVDYATKKS